MKAPDRTWPVSEPCGQRPGPPEEPAGAGTVGDRPRRPASRVNRDRHAVLVAELLGERQHVLKHPPRGLGVASASRTAKDGRDHTMPYLSPNSRCNNCSYRDRAVAQSPSDCADCSEPVEGLRRSRDHLASRRRCRGSPCRICRALDRSPRSCASQPSDPRLRRPVRPRALLRGASFATVGQASRPGRPRVPRACGAAAMPHRCATPAGSSAHLLKSPRLVVGAPALSEQPAKFSAFARR